MQIDLSYYINKAPKEFRPVLETYLPVLAREKIEDVDKWFQMYINGRGQEAIDNIVSKMTPRETIDAGHKLLEAWTLTNKNRDEFNQAFLNSLWTVAFNLALSSLKIRITNDD